MVDILEASGANRVKTPLITTPTSTISPDEIARPGVEMGQALRGVGRAIDDLGDKMDMASVPAAQAAGVAAVGRDANGDVSVQLRPFAFSKQDQAFNAAATQGLLSQAQMDAQRGLQEIAAKHPSDPTTFEKEASSFVAGLGKGAGQLRPLIQAEGTKLTQQHFLTISNRVVAQQTENAKISVTTQIQDTTNTLYALARQGGTETDEYKQGFERIGQLYSDLEKNPAYGFPAARVKSELERIKSQAFGEGVVGEVDRTYTKRGKAEAQKWLTDTIVNNPALNLSNSERASLYSTGLSRLQYLDGETKAAVAAHRTTVNTIVTGLQSKVQINDAQIDDALDKAQRLGDAESVLKITAARSIASLRRGTGLTDEQEVKLFAGIGGASSKPPPTAPAGVDTIITNAANKYGVSPQFMAKMAHIESRFDPNAFNDGSKATGLFQFIPTTWKQYGPGQDPRDPAANADAAARLTVANRNQLRASIGREPTEGELYLAHQQGAGGAASLLKDPNARAVDIVGERAVLGNGGTVNMSAGQFAQLWIRKFDGATAQVPAVASGGAPFTPAQLAANPFLGSVWIQTQVADQKETIAAASRVADAISGGIDKGVLPNSETFAAFLQMAQQFPDQLGRTRDELIAKAKGYDDALIALGEPSAVGGQMVREAQARAQGAPILVQQRAEQMKAAYDRGQKALEDQPWEEAARRNWSNGRLPGLDFSTPNGLAAGVAARSQVANSITARTGQPQPVLSKDDVAALQGVWTNGSPQQIQFVAAELARLPPEQFGSIMADKGVRDSLIGMSRSGDASKMSVAFSLMDAEQRRDPDGFHQRYGKDVENRMGAWTTRMNYMTADELAKESARYNDPAMQKARDDLRDVGFDKVKNTNASTIAGLFGWNPLPWTGPNAPAQPAQATRLEAEFRQEFAATYAEIGDEGKARELTLQRIGRVWGPSAANNGALMRFPPEKSYPTINGSHRWITDQIEADVLASFGRTPDPTQRRDGRPRASDYLAMTNEQRQEARRIDALIAAPRTLVSDARTAAEFQSGQAPSYPVVVQAPNGMFVPLQDAQGRPLRFRGDAEIATATIRAKAETEWRQTQGSEEARRRVEADAIRKRDARNARRAGAQP